MPSEPTIAFRCTAKERDEFIAAVKAAGLTREEVLLPMVREFVRDPKFLEKLKHTESVTSSTPLTAEEAEILTFIRNAGKSEGSKADVELSVVRDLRRWIEVIKAMR